MFLELEITLWHLQVITTSDIDNIFEIKNIAECIKFKHFLQMWKSKMGLESNNQSFNNKEIYNNCEYKVRFFFSFQTIVN